MLVLVQRHEEREQPARAGVYAGRAASVCQCQGGQRC